MSLRVDASSLISGALVCGNRGLGVLGSSVPSSGEYGAGYLYNDLSLPADANKEVRGEIVTPPASGAFFAYEDSSFTFDGADGNYSFTYQLYVDGAAVGSPTTSYLVIGPQNIDVENGGHGHSGVSASVTASGGTSIDVSVANGVNDHSGGLVFLSLGMAVFVSDGLSSHAGESAGVSTDTAINVSDGEFQHSGDSASVSGDPVISPSDGLHVQSGESIGLVTTTFIAVSSGVNQFSGDLVSVSIPLEYVISAVRSAVRNIQGSGRVSSLQTTTRH